MLLWGLILVPSHLSTLHKEGGAPLRFLACNLFTIALFSVFFFQIFLFKYKRQIDKYIARQRERQTIPCSVSQHGNRLPWNQFPIRGRQMVQNPSWSYSNLLPENNKKFYEQRRWLQFNGVPKILLNNSNFNLLSTKGNSKNNAGCLIMDRV